MTDPRRLRPGEVCRLLNSTPLGEVGGALAYRLGQGASAALRSFELAATRFTLSMLVRRRDRQRHGGRAP